MPPDPLAGPKPGRRPLAVLAEALQSAREEVDRLRRPPIAHDQLLAARQSLLVAMDSYAAELTARGLPIPWKLRDELRLQHSVRRQRDSSGSGR
jgi:hypothetical protein